MREKEMCPYIHIFNRTFGTYGLCMALAVVLVGFFAAVQMRARGQSVDDIFIAGGFGLGFGLICGKLLYLMVTYSACELIHMIGRGDWRFLNGGLVFYGGLLGGILGGVIGWRVARCDFLHLENSVVPFLPIGHAVGRIGCLMAGCCYGMPYEGPFAVYYPASLAGLSPTQGYFPLQIVEALCNFVICGFLLRVSKKNHRPGTVISAYLGLYGVVRFCLEFFRGDSIRGFAWILSTSQWISLLCVVCSGVFFIICSKKRILRG